MKSIQEIMKSKYVLRTVSGVAVMALLGTGFATYTTYAERNHLTAKTTQSVTTDEVSSADELTDSLLHNMKVTDHVIDKDETVYLISNSDGSIRQTIVSDHLFNRDNATSIKDLSSLTNIENVNGDESYKQTGNSLTWQADGKDIYYQGTTSDSVPITQKVTYYLNDKQVTADELAGQSGTVRIRFDYTNNSSYTEIVNGEKITVCVPFAAITGIVLPENATNIAVTNGKLISTGNSDMIVGYALPGLKDSLQIKDEDLDEDFSIPDYMEMTADVKDFELDTCMTIVINAGNMLSANGLDMAEIDDMIDQLTDASEQLGDGSTELAEGMDSLQAGLKEFSTGMNSLYAGLERYTAGTQQVCSGINSAYSGSRQLADGFNGSADRTGLVDGAKQVASGASQLNAGIQSLPSSLAKQMDQAKADTIQSLKAALTDNGMQLIYASCNVTAVTPENITAVTNTFAGETARNTFADLYSNAIKETVVNAVTEQVMANKDAITTEVTNQVMANKDTITAAVKGEVLANTELVSSVTASATESVTAEMAANGITDPATISAAIQTEVQNQLSAIIAEQVQTQISNTVRDQVTKTIQDTITEKATETIKTQTTTQYTTILAGLNRASGAIEALNGVSSGVQTSAASGDMKQLLDGANSLSNGASSLSEGVNTASNGINQLNGGLKQLATGADQLDASSDTLQSGAGKLNNATGELMNGVQKLDAGAHELNDGMLEFNERGIEKLADAYHGDLKPLADRLQAVLDASENYQSFTGIADGKNGNVKFVYKLDAIKKQA